jgi:hypothetical protein
LDQLVEPGLLDHLAGRRRYVDADLEGRAVDMAELALLHVLEQMLEAVEQALAPGLDRLLDHLRIGQGEVGGRHRIEEGAGGEAQFLADLGVHPLDRVDRAEQPLGNQQIGLADRVVERIVLPGGRGETAVAVRLLRERGALGRRAERALPDREALGPELGLHPHQLRGVCEHRHAGPGGGRLLGRGLGAGHRLDRLAHPAGEMLQHQLLRPAHHPGPVLHVLQARHRSGRLRRLRRVGLLAVGVGHVRLLLWGLI